ncbi:MAG: CoA-binding protein [Acidobacteria bacterium]|nr:MAG: CoA-binding protein [Acidobacteriota bacterium]
MKRERGENGPEAPEDRELRRILADARVVAVVGCSRNPSRDSHIVARYLIETGYEVIPVNPMAEGRILGRPVSRSLEEIEGPIDIVDVFRPASEAPAVAEAAVRAGARVLWLQLGIRSREAAEIAAAAGLAVVQDRCIMREHRRLFGRGS